MTLLEKLNLDPGAVPSVLHKRVFVASVADKTIHPLRVFRDVLAASKTFPSTLTNAEFLAACEEWLNKN